MGQSDSKQNKLTKEQREDKNILQQSIIEQRKKDITSVQQDFLLRCSVSTAIISVSEMNTVLQITETAKNQLDRGGNTLTKADLVAIVLALEPKYRKDLNKLKRLTTNDLNRLIRTIIYDPSRVENQPTQSFQSVEN